MKPLERSARLRKEADIVLDKVGLCASLRPPERIVPTGSYFLDVMVYPDIDVYLSKVSVERLFQIGGQMAACDLVLEVVFQKSRVPELPGGLYLKPRINYGDWGRPWKIDIWSVDDPLIEKKMADMVRFKKLMTAHLREQIIRYKCSILTSKHRTPMLSGYWIYKAFCDERLSDFHVVTQYLVQHGIQMG